MFPDTDAANKGKDSTLMLSAAVARVREAGWRVGNVDITVITQQPKIGPHRAAIRTRLAGLLEITEQDVFVKGKTNESMGWIGREEGLAVLATATVVPLR
jgi:2-C-methyl-D-erythritol 2,4-cyclodiphosphate synthase